MCADELGDIGEDAAGEVKQVGHEHDERRGLVLEVFREQFHVRLVAHAHAHDLAIVLDAVAALADEQACLVGSAVLPPVDGHGLLHGDGVGSQAELAIGVARQLAALLCRHSRGRTRRSRSLALALVLRDSVHVLKTLVLGDVPGRPLVVALQRRPTPAAARQLGRHEPWRLVAARVPAARHHRQLLRLQGPQQHSPGTGRLGQQQGRHAPPEQTEHVRTEVATMTSCSVTIRVPHF